MSVIKNRLDRRTQQLKRKTLSGCHVNQVIRKSVLNICQRKPNQIRGLLHHYELLTPYIYTYIYIYENERCHYLLQSVKIKFHDTLMFDAQFLEKRKYAPLSRAVMAKSWFNKTETLESQFDGCPAPFDEFKRQAHYFVTNFHRTEHSLAPKRMRVRFNQVVQSFTVINDGSACNSIIHAKVTKVISLYISS